MFYPIFKAPRAAQKKLDVRGTHRQARAQARTRTLYVVRSEVLKGLGNIVQMR